MFRFMTGSFRFLLRLFGGRRIGLRKAARRTGAPGPPFSGPSDRFLSRAEKTARWFCGLGRVAFGVDRQTRSWRHDAGKPVSGVGNRYGRKRGRIPAAAGFFISPRNATFTDRMPRRTLNRYAMSPKSFRVSRESPLLPFLLEACRSCSRTTVKSYLSHNQVEVNGRIVARFDHALSPGDEVAVFPGRRVEPLRHPMLRIVYEDEWLIVADKRSGLLSVGTQRERTRTAYYILSEHVKRSDPANRIFVVHRLDRATSGLLVFAKSERVQSLMQRTWSETVRRRTYVAVVEGAFDKKSGTVSTYLAESKGYKVFVTKDRSAGERAVTRYRVLRFRDGFSLVELELETGKKNQIRAHMEYIGHPVAGDRKYGAHGDPVGRVALHASRLCFVHPVTGRELDFSSPVPAAFGRIVK